MCPCSIPPVGLIFSVLLFLFTIIWWLNYRFEDILSEIENLKK